MKTKDEINAFLGTNTTFEGNLTFSGAVRIDGHFKGEIVTEGTLIVGETAVMESNVHASHVVISGEIRGNVLGDKRIEIHAPGKVCGNIQAPVVVIDEGVMFDGHCRMTEKENLENKEVNKEVAVIG